MITLDGITLNNSMVWVERYASQKVVQTVKRTLGSVPVVYAGLMEKGTLITLRATEEYGWIKKSVVSQLLAIAEVPGGVYILNFNGTQYSVVFRHHDSPAVDMEPLIPRTADGSDDYFIGEIKLLTV